MRAASAIGLLLGWCLNGTTQEMTHYETYLLNFVAAVHYGPVVLQWEAVSHPDKVGFYIERKEGVNSSWMEIGFVPSMGLSHRKHSYHFEDISVFPVGSVLLYRLKQIETHGLVRYGPEIEIEYRPNPAFSHLYQNKPEPFNPSTSISYQVSFRGHILLEVYDMSGRKVKTLVNQIQYPGYYSIHWDGRDEVGQWLDRGSYCYRLQVYSLTDSRSFIQTKQMTLGKGYF
ncbi:MAG: hypothetical protein ONB05_04860 [candidate division KSB1 bacterium]|nr:hypothetical protein [candidate division KSB1 bacterium]